MKGHLEPEMVLQSDAIFISVFLKEPFPSLRQHSWFHKEPFKPGFFKEPFPQIVLQKTYKGVSKNLQQMLFLGTTSGSTENVSYQGSLKNHFIEIVLKMCLKEP